MNKHTVLTFDGEGQIASILEVEYAGTLEELLDLIETENGTGYTPIEEILDYKNIPWKCISYLVDCPHRGTYIE